MKAYSLTKVFLSLFTEYSEAPEGVEVVVKRLEEQPHSYEDLQSDREGEGEEGEEGEEGGRVYLYSLILQRDPGRLRCSQWASPDASWTSKRK